MSSPAMIVEFHQPCRKAGVGLKEHEVRGAYTILFTRGDACICYIHANRCTSIFTSTT